LGELFGAIKTPITPRVLVVSRRKEQASQLAAEIEAKHAKSSRLCWTPGTRPSPPLRESTPPDCIIVEPDMLGWVSALTEKRRGGQARAHHRL